MLFIHEIMELFTADKEVEMFKELLHIAADRRKLRIEKFIEKVDAFNPEMLLNDECDVPHTEGPSEDEDTLQLAIAFWQRRHQVNSLCEGMQKEEEERRAADVRRRKQRRTNLGAIAENAKTGLTRWREVSKAIVANATFQSNIDEKKKKNRGAGERVKRRFKKAMPLSLTTEVSTAKFSLADFMHKTAVQAGIGGGSRSKIASPQNISNDFVASAAASPREQGGGYAVCRRCGERVAGAQTLRSTRRRSVKRRSSGASPETRLSSIADNSSRLEELEKIEKLQSEFRLFRSEVKTKFGMLAQTMEKIEKMLVESASLSKSKKSKKKKSSSKEKESD